MLSFFPGIIYRMCAGLRVFMVYRPINVSFLSLRLFLHQRLSKKIYCKRLNVSAKRCFIISDVDQILQLSLTCSPAKLFHIVVKGLFIHDSCLQERNRNVNKYTNTLQNELVSIDTIFL